jgi:curved DNA-binding protein CbpA
MNLENACHLLGLGRTATRQEIVAAYRRAARQWHPDGAPADETRDYHQRMQEINEAYLYLKKFLENYRFQLEEAPGASDDYQSWWEERFGHHVMWPTGKPRRRPR